MTLNDDQIQDRLESGQDAWGDLPEADRRRLEAHYAVRGRLREAMAGMTAPASLAERIASASGAVAEPAQKTDSGPAGRHVRIGPVARTLLAVAALVLLAVGVPLLIPPGPGLQAAQPQLAGLHAANVEGAEGFWKASDPCAVADRMLEEVGVRPRMPQHSRAELRGCRTARFRGHNVGTYLLDTPGGEVTLVVTEEPPEQLGLRLPPFVLDGVTFHPCHHRDCNIVAVRIDRLTYCAVGKAPHERLAELLATMLPGASTSDATSSATPRR